LITVRELIKKALWLPPEDDAGNKQKHGAKPVLYDEMMHNAYRLEGDAATEDIGSAVRGAAMDFYGKAESELTGVHSSVNRHTKFLDYSAFRNVLRESDFDLAELKSEPDGV